MKKTTLLLASCLMGVAALNAQITASTSDFPAVGDKFVVVNDSNAAVVPTPSGPGVTWNYSSLTSSTIDTIKCVSPSSTTFAGFYPAANVALEYSIGNLLDAYVNNASSELQLYGEVENINAHPYPVVYRPSSQELYKFTLTYLEGWSGNYAYRIQIPVNDSIFDSLRIQSLVGYNDTVDSYGVCTTPYGTKNVLRHRNITHTLDSTFVRDTVTGKWVYVPHSRTLNGDTTYSWIADSLGYPMLTMNMKNGAVKVASWLKNTSVTGIEQITYNAGSLVYPNPANTVLNIKLASAENGSVVIMDITGRQISTTDFSNKLANINTSALANGLYFYRISDKTGNFIDAGKFTVVK